MRHVSPQSLANLRPVSATPERARAFAKVHGIGGPMDTRKRCGKPLRAGRPCRALAAFGTGRCLRHGAAKIAGREGDPRNRATRAAQAVLMDNPPPPELTRTPAWRDALAVSRHRVRVARLAALVMAWQAGTESGDWGPWRNLSTT